MPRRAKPADELAAELAAAPKDKRLYKNQLGEQLSNYKVQSDAHKQNMLSRDCDNAIATLQAVYARGKVDLHNPEEVKLQIIEYLKSCSQAQVFPLMEGLFASFGISRQAGYYYMQKNPTSESTNHIRVFQTISSSIIQNQGLFRNADAAVVCFVSKNLKGMEFQDRLEISTPYVSEDDRPTPETIAAKYKDLMED